MKIALRALAITGLVAGLCSLGSAASMTMTGMISDSACGLSHAKMISGHPGMTDKACTLACVKNGAKYVFVSNGKIYNISNQKEASLMKDAGESVTLTGDFNGDTVTVTKLAMAKK